jgi:hypothetical protein
MQNFHSASGNRRLAPITLNNRRFVINCKKLFLYQSTTVTFFAGQASRYDRTA